jgi:hypothetical protein
MKKLSVLPIAENNIPITILASALFIIGIFGIVAGVVVFCAVNQILGKSAPYIFFGLLFGGVIVWRILLGLLVKPFHRAQRPQHKKKQA